MPPRGRRYDDGRTAATVVPPAPDAMSNDQSLSLTQTVYWWLMLAPRLLPARSPDRRSLVHRVEQRPVPRLDHTALDLHARRELSLADRHVVVENPEVLDRLPSVEPRVELVDAALHVPVDGGIRDERRVLGAGEALRPAPQLEGI